MSYASILWSLYGIWGYINAPDSAEKKTLKYEMFEDALQDPQEKNMVSILVEK